MFRGEWPASRRYRLSGARDLFMSLRLHRYTCSSLLSTTAAYVNVHKLNSEDYLAVFATCLPKIAAVLHPFLHLQQYIPMLWLCVCYFSFEYYFQYRIRAVAERDLFRYRYSKTLNKNPENGGFGWKDANNTLMAYVCDDCPSQPTGSIITVGPCALNWLNVLCLWKDSRWRWNCWENWSLPLEQLGLVTAKFVISFVCFVTLIFFWVAVIR